MSLRGECACGKVTITVPTPPEDSLGVCHCTTCRKVTGGVWARLFLPDQHALIFSGAYNLGVKAADLKVDGELKEWVETGMSGGKVSRWFCPTCSSVIWDKDELEPDMRWIKAGLFPPRSLPKPSRHIFVKNMESWQTPHEGADVKREQ